MLHFTANQRKQLARKIWVCKDACFPGRGGGKKLAGLLGISPQLLTNWMAGTRHPSSLQLAKLAEIFNISIQELCSLPCSKRKSTAFSMIITLTRYHEKAKSKAAGVPEERKRLQVIKSLIYNELGEYM